MPTILSRFDTIFIVKDEHDQQRDMVSRIQCDHHLWLLLARSNPQLQSLSLLKI